MFDQFVIADTSRKPKYIQLADAIIKQIDEGRITVNERLPSVNQLSRELEISRETVFKSLNFLSEKGIVKSSNRRGYFVQKVHVRSQLRIFMMLDKMTAFKDDLYHSFHETIGDAGEVDVFFHHHNVEMFDALIRDNLQNYTHFVIVTFMKEDVSDILNLIPPEKRVILDFGESGLEGNYTLVYQDFFTNVLDALNEAKPLLSKYNQLLLVTPSHISHFADVERGFNTFIEQTGFPGKISTQVNPDGFKRGNAYFLLRAADDRDMVEVIKLCRSRGFKLERDIGLVTYNDSPVKEILEGGITTVAVDFKKMGALAAQKIIKKEHDVEVIHSELIVRSSL